MVTGRVCPRWPAIGFTELLAGGFTVSEALVELANAEPTEAVPETETRYGVGLATVMEAGMRNVTRRVVPTTVAMAVAFVEVEVPPAAGSSFTSVLAGRMVAVGNPDPVTLMLVTPGCPAVGVAVGVSITDVSARDVPSSATIAINTAKRR